MTVSWGERKRCHVSPEIGQLLFILHFCFFCRISRRGGGFRESKAAVASRKRVAKAIKLSGAWGHWEALTSLRSLPWGSRPPPVHRTFLGQPSSAGYQPQLQQCVQLLCCWCGRGSVPPWGRTLLALPAPFPEPPAWHWLLPVGKTIERKNPPKQQNQSLPTAVAKGVFNCSYVTIYFPSHPR